RISSNRARPGRSVLRAPIVLIGSIAPNGGNTTRGSARLRTPDAVCSGNLVSVEAPVTGWRAEIGTGVGAQRIDRSELRSDTIPIGFAAPVCVLDAPLCCPAPASVAGDDAPSMGTVTGVVGTIIVLVPPAVSVVPIAGEALGEGVGAAVAPRTSAIAWAVTLSGSCVTCSVLLTLSRTRRSTFLSPPANIIHRLTPEAINIRKKIAAPMRRFRPR